MKVRLQLGWLAALGFSALMALPSAAQNHKADRPPQQQRPAARQTPRQERQPARQQERRQTQQAYHRPPAERRSSEPPRNVEPPRNSPNNNPPGLANSRNAENRPPNARRFQDLSPTDRQRVLQNREKFNQLPPQKQQEMREAARNWQKLTSDQQNHIRNNVLPKWQQMPPDRQRAIRQRLGVLQNMPESARNQHLNDPNFTRGMSEEDKAMLKDLSHMHVGAPDPPSE
ncbi:MAG TPA: DUF3106 domain-containing protein [Candidatus Acidoferrum sp.]|nr:DUF3106 domain-containing protein [Candidatus Acidoferrum sp.]